MIPRLLLPVVAFLATLAPFSFSAAETLQATAVIHGDQDGGTISRHLYGHFAEHLGRCVYDGIWVGEGSSIPNTRGMRSDIVAALRKLKIPNLRWLGGCFADDYHWRDGIGPQDKRPKRTNLHSSPLTAAGIPSFDAPGLGGVPLPRHAKNHRFDNASHPQEFIHMMAVKRSFKNSSVFRDWDIASVPIGGRER